MIDHIPLMTDEQIDDIIQDATEDVRLMGETLKRYIAAFELMSSADIQDVENHRDNLIQGFIIGRGT